jgi:hypothetical protein
MAGPSVPVPGSWPTRSARRVQRGGQTIFAVLQRLVPLARRLAWGVKALAIGSALSIAVIVGVLLGHGLASPLGTGFVLIAVAILAPAPIVLWLFHGALREVLDLPDWLRNSPDLARVHASELAGLGAESCRSEPTPVGMVRPGRRRGGFVGDSVRAGRLLLQAHDDLPGYGAVLRLMSPVFLIAVVVALFAAAFEVALALTVVVLDLVLRLIA